MRIARLAGILLALTIGLLAAPASAATSQPGSQAEVCAPGAMTITKDGPTVYDGVDCTPGAHAQQATTVTSDMVVPSGTELRPMSPAAAPAGSAAGSTSSSSLPSSQAAGAMVAIAAFAAALGFYQLSRRRQAAALASGWE